MGQNLYHMRPIARSNGLIVQKVIDEVVVFDSTQNVGHRLSPLAAKVWQCCDGQHTVVEIAQQLDGLIEASAIAEDMVMAALEELQACNLLESEATQSTVLHSARTFNKRGVAAGVAGAAMLPLISSMLVPAPAMAASPPPMRETPPEPPEVVQPQAPVVTPQPEPPTYPSVEPQPPTVEGLF